MTARCGAAILTGYQRHKVAWGAVQYWIAPGLGLVPDFRAADTSPGPGLFIAPGHVKAIMWN